MSAKQKNLKAGLELRADPVLFAKKVLGINLWIKQREAIRALEKYQRVTIRSGHNVGKTLLAAVAALWYLPMHRNSIVVTTAPTFRQVEQLLWREMRKAHGNALQPVGGTMLTTKWEMGASREDWYAIGLSTDDPDKITGFHAKSGHILYIVDEAGGVEEPTYEAIEGSLSNIDARLLLIGNPTAMGGTFFASHRDASYTKIHISCFDSPNFTKFGITLDDLKTGAWENKVTGEYPRPYFVSPQWAAERLKKWGETSPMFQSRVLGNFPEQGSDTLIPLSLIEKAINRELPEIDVPTPVRAGVDVARFGSSKTVFVARRSGTVLEIVKYGMGDIMDTAGNLLAFARKWGNTIICAIDNVGVGAGVVDYLRSEGHDNMIGINVGTKPQLDEENEFTNLRAELYWNLRERFVDGTISIPNDEDLIGELANLKYKFDRFGRIQIESKEEMVKRHLPSPDTADALMLAFGEQSTGTVEASSSDPEYESIRPDTAGWLNEDA